MILQTYGALARVSHGNCQCLDKYSFTALALNLTRVASLRRPYLGRYEARDPFRPASERSLFNRSYATDAVSRPKAHTGRTPSAPRKKASTATTVAPTAGLGPVAATKEPATKKTKPKAKSKANPKEKSKSKPRTRAKSTKARKSSSKAKAKPAKKKKKALKPEAKERQIIKELKAKALTPPKKIAATAFQVLLAEKSREARLPVQKGADAGAGSVAKECSRIYRSFTPEQREHYNHIANQNKMTNDSSYREWILTYSPAEIDDANRARKALKSRLKSSSFPKLHDERLVTHPRTAYVNFTVQRHRSGDFAGMSFTEAAKLIGAEWRALSESDKKPYVQEGVADCARYEQEVKAVYDRDVQHKIAKAA
ncbi:MAG: hypothetical protein Q9178_000472 [Gyalolechia marmorata]